MGSPMIGIEDWVPEAGIEDWVPELVKFHGVDDEAVLDAAGRLSVAELLGAPRVMPFTPIEFALKAWAHYRAYGTTEGILDGHGEPMKEKGNG